MQQIPVRTLAVVGCSQLVTLSGPARPRVGPEMRDLGVIQNGAMLVEDRVIKAVGWRAAIEESLPPGAAVVDVQGRVVMPGFVDAHTHPVFGGDRLDDFEMRCSGSTYAEIAAAGGGIRSTVLKTREMPTKALLDRAKHNARRFLRNGTTTVEAKSGYGLSIDEELRLLRVIRAMPEVTPLRVVPTLLAAHAVPDGTDQKSYTDKVALPLIAEAAAAGLAEYCDAFCEPGYFDVDQVRRIMKTAAEHGLKLRLHADQLSLSGGALLAAEFGAATADHLEQVDARSIAAMRSAGVQPVLLPGSVYALGLRRYAPAREMIDGGLPVAIATDFNPGSSPTPAMPMILSLACTQMKMTPAEAVCASTINAAWSLDRGASLGSLGPGKQADFTVFDCADWREIVCFFGVEQVWQTFVAGATAYACEG